VFALLTGGHGFDPRLPHTKDVTKMVPDASLLCAPNMKVWHLSPLKARKKKKRLILS